MATLMVVSIVRGTSTDFEPAATIEYVASVLLERGDQRATAERVSEPEKNAAVQRTLERVRGLALHSLNAGRHAASTASSPLQAIAASLKTSDALNRWPGYEDQIVAFMGEVFDEPTIAAHLRADLGFNAAEAIACDRAMRSIAIDRFFAWRDHVPHAIEEAVALWDSGARPTPPGLEVRPGTTRQQRFWWLVAQYLTSEHLAQVMSVDEVELAEAAEVETTVARAFIDRFSSRWGASRGLTLLTGRNEVRQRPLLRATDGRAHPTSPGNLLWALRPALETSLKQDPSAFERYQARRAATTEREAARHLEQALRPDFLRANLNFKTPAGNGETDILLRVDDLLVIVEAKAGVLSDGAYQGRTTSLRRDLLRLLGKSTEQTSRLAEALRDQASVAFSDRTTGEPVDVELEGVGRLRRVVVTLEDLGPIVMRPSRLVEAAIVDDGATFPWCVSLFDLEVIAKSTQFPAQLTSYLDVRPRIDPRAEWPGEDDLWITHLLSRLSFDHVEAPLFMVDGRTDLLADQWTLGRPAPRSDLPKATKKALQRLSRERPPGWLRRTEDLFAEAQVHRRPKIVSPELP
jgi:Holliday junction resolvase-like predicted endonuclease